MLKIGKSIEEIDREFASAAGLSLEEFYSLDLMGQSKIKRRFTNQKLKIKC